MNDDLISRRALIKAIKTECNPYGKPTIDFESGKKVLKIIENFPTVEQPTGEWMEETVPVAFVGRGNRQCRCSNCGHGDIQAKTQEVPYCWFCGAKMKMKGGEEE